MRMNKTAGFICSNTTLIVQALAIIEAFRDEWPALIVTPSTLRDTWADAAHQWLKVIDSDMQVIWKEADILSAQRSHKLLVICSYDLMPKAKVKTVCMAEKWFKVVVCDESHYIKSHTVRALTRKGGWRIEFYLGCLRQPNGLTTG
jgi:hypothetical protein